MRRTPPEEPPWTVYLSTVQILRDATLSAAIARTLNGALPTPPGGVAQVVNKTSVPFFGWAQYESYRVTAIDLCALGAPPDQRVGKQTVANLSLERLVNETTFVRQDEERGARGALGTPREQLDRPGPDGAPSLRQFRNKSYAHADLEWATSRFRKHALWLPPMRVALGAARAAVNFVGMNSDKDDRVEKMLGQIDGARRSVEEGIDTLFRMAMEGLRRHHSWDEDHEA